MRLPEAGRFGGDGGGEGGGVVVVTINCPPGPITTCVSGSFREEEALGLRGGKDGGVGDATIKLPSRVMTT